MNFFQYARSVRNIISANPQDITGRRGHGFFSNFVPAMIREYFDTSLKEYNTFGIDVSCKRLLEYESAEELADILRNRPDATAGRWAVLGGGSNVLFTDDFDGTLLHPSGGEICITGRDAGKTFVRADAGIKWDELTRWCAERNLWGTENLAGIPGTVGAAPVQNIGAYGAEAADVIASVETLDPQSLAKAVIAAPHCGFGYRDSVFKRTLKGRTIITAVNLALSEIPAPKLTYGALAEIFAGESEATPALVRETVLRLRNEKLPDPQVTGNAGSFFKNPVVERTAAEKLSERWPDMPSYRTADADTLKLAAAWLIEKAGWKGRREGRAGVHDRQALVLVNHGCAEGGEVLALARRIQDDVERLFGIRIETEVNIL